MAHIIRWWRVAQTRRVGRSPTLTGALPILASDLSRDYSDKGCPIRAVVARVGETEQSHYRFSKISYSNQSFTHSSKNGRVAHTDFGCPTLRSRFWNDRVGESGLIRNLSAGAHSSRDHHSISAPLNALFVEWKNGAVVLPLSKSRFAISRSPTQAKTA